MALDLGFKVEDLIEEKRINEKKLKIFKCWLYEKGFNLITDEQAAQFLVACNNQLELAQTSFIEYFRLRNEYKELFTNRNLDSDIELQKVIEIIHFNIIPRRTEDDCVILIFKLIDSDYKKFHLIPALKLLSLVLDIGIYNYPPKGLIVIFDLHEMAFMHLTHFNLKMALQYIHYLQEALPINLKAIHMVNVNYLVQKLISLLKPLMKQNLKNLLFVHAKCGATCEYKNPDCELYKNLNIDKDYLPSDYGGNLESIEYLHGQSMRVVRDFSKFFELEEKQRCDMKAHCESL